MTAFDHTPELSRNRLHPRGHVQAMIAFIDDHRQAYGVEPICRVLPIAPSTYHTHVTRCADLSRLPDRIRRDADLKVEIRRVFEENFRVYGVRKVWRQLRRKGFSVARLFGRPVDAGHGHSGGRSGASLCGQRSATRQLPVRWIM